MGFLDDLKELQERISAAPNQKKNLKEPDSLEIIQWGKVKRAGTGYSVTCTFRARNSFGGYNVQTHAFLFNDGGYLISTAPMD